MKIILLDTRFSMNEIIDIDDYRPHMTGKAHCLICKHEFDGVADIGTTYLPCPNCEAEKAVFTYPVEYKEKHWGCKCGNMLFLITDKFIYCPNCGSKQYGF